MPCVYVHVSACTLSGVGVCTCVSGVERAKQAYQSPVLGLHVEVLKVQTTALPRRVREEAQRERHGLAVHVAHERLQFVMK